MHILKLSLSIKITNQLETTAIGKKMGPEPRSLAVFQNLNENEILKQLNRQQTFVVFKKKSFFSLAFISFYLENINLLLNVSGYKEKDYTF